MFYDHTLKLPLEVSEKICSRLRTYTSGDDRVVRACTVRHTGTATNSTGLHVISDPFGEKIVRIVRSMGSTVPVFLLFSLCNPSSAWILCAKIDMKHVKLNFLEQ